MCLSFTTFPWQQFTDPGSLSQQTLLQIWLSIVMAYVESFKNFFRKGFMKLGLLLNRCVLSGWFFLEDLWSWSCCWIDVYYQAVFFCKIWGLHCVRFICLAFESCKLVSLNVFLRHNGMEGYIHTLLNCLYISSVLTIWRSKTCRLIVVENVWVPEANGVEWGHEVTR